MKMLKPLNEFMKKEWFKLAILIIISAVLYTSSQYFKDKNNLLKNEIILNNEIQENKIKLEENRQSEVIETNNVKSSLEKVKAITNTNINLDREKCKSEALNIYKNTLDLIESIYRECPAKTTEIGDQTYRLYTDDECAIQYMKRINDNISNHKNETDRCFVRYPVK